MDIKTPKGVKSLLDERKAVQLYLRYHPEVQFVETNKKMPLAVDGLVIEGGRLRSLVEIKCRYDADLDMFFDEYSGEWLITMAKVEKAIGLATGLGVSFEGWLYVVQSNALLVLPISSVELDADECVKATVQNLRKAAYTDTQATINGGTANRLNGYFDLYAATLYQGRVV